MATFIVLGSSHTAYLCEITNKNGRSPNWHSSKLYRARRTIRMSKSDLIFQRCYPTDIIIGILLAMLKTNKHYDTASFDQSPALMGPSKLSSQSSICKRSHNGLKITFQPSADLIFPEKYIS